MMTTKQTEKGLASLLRHAWRAWKVIARKIGDFQARLVLTVLYFLPLAPFALAVKWSTDPMAIKRATPKGWRPIPDAEAADSAARQF